jgi:4-amino-4-deoxy-L-arabinose transferase-like glycosyltransferase
MSERSTAMTSFWTRPLPIIAVALLFRLAWAAFVPVEPISDGILYDAFAKSIVAGQGYAFADGTMTEYWPVGTSAIYALFYLVFGQHPWVLPTFQAFLGAYIVYLTWRLAEHTFGAKVAAVAAWLTASWPLLIEFTTINASELLFIALVLMALNIWIPNRIPPTFRMILWGACIAAATYVRPTALPVVIAFPAIQWMIDRNGRALIRSVLISALTASLLFAPWSYRSLALFDRFVLVSANGGVNLWMGNNPDSTGGYMELPGRQFSTEVDRDHFYGGEAVKFILARPLKYAVLSMKRAVTTFDRETIGIVWNQKALAAKYQDITLSIMKRISSAYWWVLLVAGIAGAVLAMRRQRFLQCWPVLAALAYFSAFPILTVAMDRYHVPIDPLLAIFAAYAFCSIKRRPDVGGTSG